ncbi:MAG: hypothetical protein K1X91_09400 [Bacteriodetes bacterium]|nr:hypothetical protein [Bacteroidota bacterium]
MKSQQQHQEQIIFVLQQHYTSPQLSVSMLADYLNISRQYLVSICLACCGKTPSTLIHCYRIKKALELQALLGKENFCCTMVGYSNHRTYQKALRKFNNVQLQM